MDFVFPTGVLQRKLSQRKATKNRKKNKERMSIDPMALRWSEKGKGNVKKRNICRFLLCVCVSLVLGFAETVLVFFLNHSGRTGFPLPSALAAHSNGGPTKGQIRVGKGEQVGDANRSAVRPTLASLSSVRLEGYRARAIFTRLEGIGRPTKTNQTIGLALHERFAHGGTFLVSAKSTCTTTRK